MRNVKLGKDNQSCSVVTLDRLRKELPNGMFFVLVTQKGCGACPPAKRVLKRIASGKVPIVEVPVEAEGCGRLADRMGIDEMPGLVYYENGKKPRRIDSTTDAGVARKIEEIVRRAQHRGK